MVQYWRRPEYIALVISSLAVGVSLFDPISGFLAESDLIVDLPGNLTAGTNLGHFSIRPAISIVNKGNATGEFSRIDCKMREARTGRLVEMSVETIQTPSGANPLTAYALPPGGIFYNYVNCVVVPSVESIDAHTALLREVSGDLRARGFQDCRQQYTPQAIEVSRETATKLQNYFDQSFDISPGSYVLTLDVYSADDVLVATQNSNLEISPEAIREIRSAASNLRFGVGAGCPSTEVGTVSLKLTRGG